MIFFRCRQIISIAAAAPLGFEDIFGSKKQPSKPAALANWFCFKFWFCFRLLLASMAHFNWFAAIYVNCIYFTLWKSYDILWFWTHLALCVCFPALRPENYLLVFVRLVRAKRGEHANKSYKEIYELLYKHKTGETKAECELKRIETLRKDRREQRRRSQKQTGPGLAAADESSTCTGSEDDGEATGQQRLLYPKLGREKAADVEEQAMPSIRVDRSRPAKEAKQQKEEGQGLISYGLSAGAEDAKSTSTAGGRQKPKFWGKMKLFSRRTDSQKREEADKKQVKREEQAHKLLEKRARKERRQRKMAQLREQARKERSRKNFADGVDLLLTYCRLITSFAVLVGNIHKTFLPRYLAPPLENVYDSPDLLMIFTITLLLDVGLFWLLILWSFCQQLGLCCRLGLCRFLLWCGGLLLLGGFCMLYPMHFIHEQLDGTWCQFEEGEPLSQYFDG